MYGSLADIRELVPHLHLSQRETKKLLHLNADFRLTPPQLEAWLKVVQVPQAARATYLHLQTYLPPLIRNSISVQAEEAKRQAELAAEREAVIEVNQPLEAPDMFRADASIGPRRLEPEVINRIAAVGVLDLFVREDNPFIEDKEFRQLVVPVEDFRRNLLHDYRHHNEALTGPEFQQQHPHHPLLKRKTLPAAPFLQVDGARQRLILLPERPVPFRWEITKETP